MKDGQTLWTKEQLILAIHLYSKLPFGKLDKNTPEVKELASLIGRSNNAVALKLVNFASIDPKLQARGIKGMKNAGELTEQVFRVFYNNWDDYFFESEKILAQKKHTTVEKLNDIEISDLPKSGKEREALVKVRVNQKLFRTLLDANYNYKCCITGIDNSELLIASHIVPWSKDEKNRLNPANGLLLNTLHDRAFERGLITITTDYKLKVSSILLKNKIESITRNFSDLNNRPILLPKKFKPDIEFLKKHNERFRP